MTSSLRAVLLLPLIPAALSCDGTDSSSSVERPVLELPPRLQVPPHPFRDITAEAGITFRHETGGFGRKYLPETMGSGGGFLDFDGDGRLDIFLVNSDFWPGQEKGPRPLCVLYRAMGEGIQVRYENATERANLARPIYGMGAALADYDGDGHTDIYVTALGDNVLWRNRGDGTFEDATSRAGVAGGRWIDREGKAHPEWSTSAAWADFDVDGDIDLFVANFVQWNMKAEIFTTLDGVHKAFTTPEGYKGCAGRLFLNRGDGTFTDATKGSGIDRAVGKSLGVAIWDFEGDGLPDMVIANDTQPNFFFRNQGEGRFQEAGLEAGIAYDMTGRARAGMGIDIADWRNSGLPAVAIGNFSQQSLTLYSWNPDGHFEDVAEEVRLSESTEIPLTFGLRFFDYDLNGFQDLVLANGHLEPAIQEIYSGLKYEQQPLLLRNDGKGRFDDVTSLASPGFSRKLVGRGLALGDIDGDGDQDILITSCGGSPLLLRNDGPLPGGPDGNHYLQVRLRGKGMNTAALGALVTLKAGGLRQTRMARSGSSYLSESEPVLTFGLGTCRTVDELTVRWPLGRREKIDVPGVDRTLEVIEK